MAGCAREDAAHDIARAALGLPAGDFPSYDERVALYATNRARADPSAEGWPAYPAQPPLLWQVDLNHAARAHAQDMHDTPCFQHNSCDGTDAFKRVLGYYAGPWSSIGENIAAGKSISDGFIAVHNWINEVGAAPGETGHRDNIFSAKFTLLGDGFVPGGTAFQNYWTQDFIATPVTHPRLADGIHFPATAAAGGAITFGTTYHDTSGAAPSRLAVVVDGACTPLALARGAPARGAYEARLSLGAGCHPYLFLATTAGADVTYPDSGALQVGVGVAAATCPLAVTTRAGNGCAPPADGGAPPDDGAAGGSGGHSGAGGTGGGGGSAGGGDGPGGTGGTADVGGAGGATGSSDTGSDGAAPPGAGTAGTDDSSDGGTAPLPPPADRGAVSAGWGCALAPAHGSDAGHPLAVAAMALAAAAARRRRQRR